MDRSIDGPAAFVQTNVLGTFRMLEAARRYWSRLSAAEAAAFRFLHVSTDEVYGSLGATGAFTEATAYRPNSPYSASKAASDHFVRAYHHTYGLPVLTTNCSNNYGPYQFPEKLIPLMILNAWKASRCPCTGTARTFGIGCSWKIIARRCGPCFAAGSPARFTTSAGIVSGRISRSSKPSAERLKSFVPNLPHAPCRGLITRVKDRPGHDRRYAIDAGKIHRELGWQPRQDFDSGLARTVEWYLSNAKWVERVTTGKYRRERLGLG